MMQVEAADIAVLIDENISDCSAKHGDGADREDLAEEETADVLQG